MMHHKYFLSDVFTDKMFGGNQLAVFPHAETVPVDAMQNIARELNLSETVFVLPTTRADCVRRLRIFTPGEELPFAGHPTIGTACTLAEIGMLPLTDGAARFAFEEGVGPIEFTVTKTGDRFSAQFAAGRPKFEASPVSVRDIALVLNLSPGDIIDDAEVASCGVPFLFVPLRSRSALAQIHVSRDVWQSLLAATAARHIYAFTTEVELPASHVRSRMFAPAMGIVEDPATGGAAAPLAGYLAMRKPEASGTFAWQIEQGFDMGRPSILLAKADKEDGTVTEVRVAGSSILVGEGTLNIS